MPITKPTTIAALVALREAGSAGITTHELIQLEHQIGSRYSARFYELRQAGCEIGSRRERQGSERFFLLYEPPDLLQEASPPPVVPAPDPSPAPATDVAAGEGDQLGLGIAA